MTFTRRQARDIVARGEGAWERDEFEAALEAFSAVLAEYPDFADVHHKAGLCAAMLGRPEEALAHFEEALARNDAYAEAHMNRGIVLSEMGRTEEAKVAFDRTGELDTREGERFPAELGHRIAEAHGRLAGLYVAAGRPDEALRHFESALEVRPHFMDIRARFAECLAGEGALERARQEFTRVLEARPGYVDARIRLGAVLQRLGDVAGAIEQWRRAAEQDPGDSRPSAYLASTAPPEAGADG